MFVKLDDWKGRKRALNLDKIELIVQECMEIKFFVRHDELDEGGKLQVSFKNEYKSEEEAQKAFDELMEEMGDR